MGVPSFESADDFTKFVKQRIPGRRKRNREENQKVFVKKPRRIDAEIVSISP